MSTAESKDDTVRTLPSDAGHTPTPWSYRPARFDDWGWIRGPIGEGDSIAPLVATARSGQYENVDMLDKHRAAGTDPYGANAAFIIKAVNSHERLLNALEEIARQKTSVELFAEFGEEFAADFENGYDEIVQIARAAVSPAIGKAP